MFAVHSLVPVRALVWLACASVLAHTAVAQKPKIESTAVTGKPFGVGVMTVTFPEASPYTAKPDVPYSIHAADGRVLYPAFDHQLTTSTITGDDGNVYKVTSLLQIDAYFLFRGDKPIKLTLDAPDARYSATATLEKDDAAHETMVNTWWQHYRDEAQRNFRDDAYPPLVENYLTLTLARRMKLAAPNLRAYPWSQWRWANEFFGAMTGAESVRVAMQKKTLLKGTDKKQEIADQPLPKPVLPRSIAIPAFDDDKVVVEPIAQHVPEECFYVRAGSYDNFRWLQKAVDQWGTRIRDLGSVRAVDYHIPKRLQRQLGVKETTLGRLFGATVIEDVAIIGTDTFVREGAAIGILFQAKNTVVLREQLLKLQRESENLTLANGVIVRDPEWRITEERIGRGTATFAHTPDNRVRSFYVVDGDYHLVTTSRTIARRFLEAGSGKGSLADLKEFRYARSLMPLANDYETFVYLSDPFFRLMVSPHYRVEMTRRMQAAAEMDMVRVALLAAKAEGIAIDSSDDLIKHDLLPQNFGKRADGTTTNIARSPLTGLRVVDSRRGSYGALLPVPDVKIDRLTPSEVTAYQQFAIMYRNQWERMDPVIIGLQREKTDRPGIMRVVADVHIAPYPRRYYGEAQRILGKPIKRRVSKLRGDVVSIEANTKASFWGMRGVLFARLHDFAPRFAIKAGKVDEQARENEKLVPYYGGLTEPLVALLAPEKDRKQEPDGDILVHKGSPEVWGRKTDDWFLLASQRPLLKKAAEHVRMEDASRPAQMRLSVADLQKTKIAPILQAYSYTQARKVSAGNSRWLNMLNQQLGVAPKDAILATENLLQATPTCPLGGKYRLDKLPDGRQYWTSTAWRFDSLAQVASVPTDYRSPLLEWFAGLEVEFQITPDVLTTHIELEMRE